MSKFVEISAARAFLFLFGASMLGAAFALAGTVPQHRFILDAGEAFDRKTGLTWQRCAVGRTWLAGTCAGAESALPWDEAMARGQEGWRVPTKDELSSLFEDTAIYPKIDTAAFPDAAANRLPYYWTSSRISSCLDESHRGCAVIVGFNGDLAAYAPFSGAPIVLQYPVRLVRGDRAPTGTAVSAAIPTETESADHRFLLKGGEAIDKARGLRWQRCDAGRAFSPEFGCQGVARRYTLEQAKALEGNGWRLPTIKELETLFDHRYDRPGDRRPLIDDTVFIEVGATWPGSEYWTSTIYAGSYGKQVWCVNFLMGWKGTNCVDPPARSARLVRSAE